MSINKNKVKYKDNTRFYINIQTKRINHENIKQSLRLDLNAPNNRETREEFNNVIDNLFDGKIPKENQKIYEHAPQILQIYGAGDYPLIMSPNELIKAIMTIEEANNIGHNTERGKSYHALGKDGFNEAIDNLSEPVMIIKNIDKLIVFTESFDYKNRQIIVPIKINTQSQFENQWGTYNVALSAHGRSSIDNFINNQLNNGAEIVYEGK